MDPRADPFDLKGGPDAVLLIHGFTGCPAEMRPAADVIHQTFGWRAYSPLLPGHGTTPDDLNRYGRADWMRAVEDSLALLTGEHERVHLMGLSMGALLAVELFRKHPDRIQSLLLLSPPVFVRNFLEKIVLFLMTFPNLARFAPAFPKWGPTSPDHVAYDCFPARASGEFEMVSREVRTLRKADTPPALICYSEADSLVDLKSAEFLLERLSNPLTRIVRLERSLHIITIGVEKDLLFDEMRAFYREITPLKAGSAISLF
jgi:carboxylesterase